MVGVLVLTIIAQTFLLCFCETKLGFNLSWISGKLKVELEFDILFDTETSHFLLQEIFKV